MSKVAIIVNLNFAAHEAAKQVLLEKGATLVNLEATKAPVAIVADTGIDCMDSLRNAICDRIDAEFGDENNMYWGDTPVAEVVIDNGGEPRFAAYDAFLDHSPEDQADYDRIKAAWDAF